MAEIRAPTVRLICDAGAVIGESPVWQDDRVLWTDPVSRRLLSVVRGQAGEWGHFESIATTSPVWSLAPLPEGAPDAVIAGALHNTAIAGAPHNTAIAGALDDRFCVIAGSGEIGPEINAGPPATIDPGCRFNDMTVDPQGGLWVGMMHRGVLATRGAIFHARSLREAPTRVADGLGVPNGMKLSADGSTLFVIDTLERTLLAYPVDDGALGEPAIVSDFLGAPGKPDGMTLAPDGTFWVAMWGGSCIVQIAGDGAFLRRIELPAPHVSSLCCAGVDRLLVTTSRMRLSPRALLDHAGSGGLFEVLLEPA